MLGSVFLAQLVVGGFMRAGLHSHEAAAAELLVVQRRVHRCSRVLFLFQARGTIAQCSLAASGRRGRATLSLIARAMYEHLLVRPRWVGTPPSTYCRTPRLSRTPSTPRSTLLRAVVSAETLLAQSAAGAGA